MKKYILLLILAMIFAALAIQAQTTTKTFTCYWTHDGTNTDGYNYIIDGVTIPATGFTCTGDGAARACQAPITLVLNMQHVVKVQAYNGFGSADSDPTTVGPPSSNPSSVVIK